MAGLSVEPLILPLPAIAFADAARQFIDSDGKAWLKEWGIIAALAIANLIFSFWALRTLSESLVHIVLDWWQGFPCDLPLVEQPTAEAVEA